MREQRKEIRKESHANQTQSGMLIRPKGFSCIPMREGGKGLERVHTGPPSYAVFGKPQSYPGILTSRTSISGLQEERCEAVTSTLL